MKMKYWGSKTSLGMIVVLLLCGVIGFCLASRQAQDWEVGQKWTADDVRFEILGVFEHQILLGIRINGSDYQRMAVMDLFEFQEMIKDIAFCIPQSPQR